MAKFSRGDFVRWRSQAGSYSREKVGVIVEVVRAGQRPDESFQQLHRGSGVGLPRDHESYVVQVQTRTYWPRVKHLKAAAK